MADCNAFLFIFVCFNFSVHFVLISLDVCQKFNSFYSSEFSILVLVDLTVKVNFVLFCLLFYFRFILLNSLFFS